MIQNIKQASKRRKKEAEKLASKSSSGLSGLHSALNGSQEKVSQNFSSGQIQADQVIERKPVLNSGEIEAGVCEGNKTIQGKSCDQR